MNVDDIKHKTYLELTQQEEQEFLTIVKNKTNNSLIVINIIGICFLFNSTVGYAGNKVMTLMQVIK